MSSETYFDIHVKGCAEAAYKISDSRNCVVDLRSILLESEDNLRQIHMLNHVLGIRAAAPPVPVPPTGPAPAATRPTPFSHHRNSGSQNSSSPSNSGNRQNDDAMLPMTPIMPHASPPLDQPLSVITASVSVSMSSRNRTFSSVSAMRRLAHEVPADLPIDVVAANALKFVAAWRCEDAQASTAEDLIHGALSARQVIEATEEESRSRLQSLHLSVTEQMDRFIIMSEYDKFVVFCMENEPVWRHAARQLQSENDARLNTTANIYARFLFEDSVLADKLKMYQEAADFVVSLRLAEREQRSVALTKAVARRRRQSVSEVVTPVPTPQLSSTGRRARPPTEGGKTGAAATAAPSSGTRSAPNTANAGSGGTPEGKGGATQRVKPLTSVMIDNYREGWRAMLGHVTNGEVGRAPHHSSSPPPAAAAAPLKHHDDKARPTSPHHPRNDPRQQNKSRDVVLPPAKEERRGERKDEKRQEAPLQPLTGDKNTRLPLPQVTKKVKANAAAAAPPPPKSRDEQRGNRHSSRDKAAEARTSKDEVVACKAKAEGKAKESRPVAVKAAPPPSAEDKQRDHHQHREGKVR